MQLRERAAACYNAAFDAMERGDSLLALELAAASLNLWREAGNDKNISISLWLYSRTLLGVHAESAALEAINLAGQHLTSIVDPEDWLVASLLEGRARAIGASTSAAIRASYAAAYQSAAEAVSRIVADDDRELIAGQFADWQPPTEH